MGRILFALAILCSCSNITAQTDSLANKYKNVVSLEVGGGSYGLLGFGNMFNLGYHRFFRFKSNNWLTISERVAVGLYKASVSPPPRILKVVFVPIESELLLGKSSLKVDFGIGYTPVFGEQQFHTGYYPNPEIKSLNFYDFWTMKMGLCYSPKRYRLPYISVAWMPAFISSHNPLPYDDTSRIRLGWGGVEIGFAF